MTQKKGAWYFSSGLFTTLLEDAKLVACALTQGKGSEVAEKIFIPVTYKSVRVCFALLGRTA